MFNLRLIIEKLLNDLIDNKKLKANIPSILCRDDEMVDMTDLKSVDQ